jgi:hypothetical protein
MLLLYLLFLSGKGGVRLQFRWAVPSVNRPADTPWCGGNTSFGTAAYSKEYLVPVYPYSGMFAA